MPDLTVDRDWTIPAKDLSFRYAKSGGPGGQHVNKVATKAELRFAFEACQALSPAQKRRLRKAHPARVTQGGELVMTSDRYRSRRQNEADLLARLALMLRAVRSPPKRRIPTKVTLAAKRRRIEQKRMRGAQKRLRTRRHDD